MHVDNWSSDNGNYYTTTVVRGMHIAVYADNWGKA